MIQIPVGVTKSTTLNPAKQESSEGPPRQLFYPTDYTWAALPVPGSDKGLMKNVRTVSSLIFVIQGGIGLVAQAPTIGQVWPRGNPEVTSD